MFQVFRGNLGFTREATGWQIFFGRIVKFLKFWKNKYSLDFLVEFGIESKPEF